MSTPLLKESSQRVIGCFYKVYNTLGFGFSEKVYENALVIELTKAGFNAVQQKPIKVFYENQIVGDYYADIIVDDCLLLELKVSTNITPEFEAQIMNYLKATKIEVGYILNFGFQPQFLRRIFTNDKK